MAIENYTPSQQKTVLTIYSGADIFLTGKPGTGKTELIKDICERKRAEGKKVLITASTGLAASNYDGGRTIHSVLRWHPNKKDYNYKECALELNFVDILVIDEVSTLNWEIINHIDRCFGALKRRPQLIIAGDFFQLPPVTPKGYYRRYPFENRNWVNWNLKACILKEVIRQTDPEFKKNLDYARLSDPRCISYFNNESSQILIDGAITLCTRKAFAEAINKQKLEILSGKPCPYYARGTYADRADFKDSRADECLVVKKHMRVISLRNDPDGKYLNGSLGTIIDFCDDYITVRFDNGHVEKVYRVKYALSNIKVGEPDVEIEQFPLSGGYAITIHKSQGQTFDYVNIQAPDCWDPGQLYVALSRARSIKGIHLVNKIGEKSLKTDPRVVEFYRNMFGEEYAA